MPKKVTFGMYWEMYAHQTIDLPDDIDANDTDAVKEYIKSIWPEIPVPTSEGSYVMESDNFDEDSPIVVIDE